MKIIDAIKARAAQNKQHIVLPEGADIRILDAAQRIEKEKLASVTVLGDKNAMEKLCAKNNVDMDSFAAIEPARSELLADFADTYAQMRKAKQDVTREKALELMSDENWFAAMMTRKGLADGFVSGAIHPTADTCRAAFRVIGVSPDVKIASSFSLMQTPIEAFGVNGALLYADTGTVPNPNAEELADIAIASARSAWALFNAKPKVAMISFSTKGSAKHSMLEKIIQATEMAKARARQIGIEADIDGEMQADAALIPKIGAGKAPGSPVAGKANVLVFPDLNVGNTAYKLTERIGGAAAYGPVLQGLNMPVSDLSRGCSAEDIVGIAAIVACQAISLKT